MDEYLIENQLEREAVKKEKSKSDTLHSYSPQEFGLTEDELCSGKYAEYIDKFSVPMSKNWNFQKASLPKKIFVPPLYLLYDYLWQLHRLHL